MSTNKKVFKKYNYDIAFDEEVGNHLVSWVTGLMVFFVTLTLAVNLALSAISQTWVDDLSGALTIELKPPIQSSKSAAVYVAEQQQFQEKVKRIMTMLRDRSDVSETKLLNDSEVRNLIMPWIGNNISLDTIPLPTLIDVRMNEHTNVTQLKLDITKIDPAASIDTHTATISDIEKMTSTSGGFVMLISAVIALLAVVSISGIVRSKLMIHQPEVETLHLMGASNEYIASQFRHHTLRKTLIGAVTGTVFTVAVLATIGSVTETLNANVFAYVQIMPLEWALIVFAPIAIGVCIAHITAQATALRELSKLP